MEAQKRLSELESKMCTGKKTWASKKYAKRGLVKANIKFGEHMTLYKCLFCRNYHIGHKKRPITLNLDDINILRAQ